MKPLSTKPIINDGVTIANAYQWSFGWCSEWVHFHDGKLVPQAFADAGPDGKHEIFQSFEALEAALVAYYRHRLSQGCKVANPNPPTIEVRFSGASDDLVDVEGCEGADEFGAIPSGDREGTAAATFLLEGYGGAVHVIAIYNGCWSFAVSQTEQDEPLPPWPIRVQVGGRGYSADLIVTCPVGTRVSELGEEGQSDDD